MISATIVEPLDMKRWIKVVELDASWEAPGAAPAARLSDGFTENKFLFRQINGKSAQVPPRRATVKGLKVKIPFG